ncbi:uncharacterized protein LOC143446391 [Clavelina lepadiformis]|uniref:uncharacterized protein LOC143446391 n=1 Tax=Clavelina lepadiformis TaxID=159417 RepID=UPI004042962B
MSAGSQEVTIHEDDHVLVRPPYLPEETRTFTQNSDGIRSWDDETGSTHAEDVQRGGNSIDVHDSGGGTSPISEVPCTGCSHDDSRDSEEETTPKTTGKPSNFLSKSDLQSSSPEVDFGIFAHEADSDDSARISRKITKCGYRVLKYEEFFCAQNTHAEKCLNFLENCFCVLWIASPTSAADSGYMKYHRDAGLHDAIMKSSIHDVNKFSVVVPENYINVKHIIPRELDMYVPICENEMFPFQIHATIRKVKSAGDYYRAFQSPSVGSIQPSTSHMPSCSYSTPNFHSQINTSDNLHFQPSSNSPTTSTPRESPVGEERSQTSDSFASSKLSPPQADTQSSSDEYLTADEGNS